MAEAAGCVIRNDLIFSALLAPALGASTDEDVEQVLVSSSHQFGLIHIYLI